MRCLLFCVICLVGLVSPGCGDSEPGVRSPLLPESGTLFGTPPPRGLNAPEFKATNRDGTRRGRSALLGQPTVLWFFPAASSAG